MKFEERNQQPDDINPKEWLRYTTAVGDIGPKRLAEKVGEELKGQVSFDQVQLMKSYRFERRNVTFDKVYSDKLKLPMIVSVLLPESFGLPKIVIEKAEAIRKSPAFLREVAEEAYMRALPSQSS